MSSNKDIKIYICPCCGAELSFRNIKKFVEYRNKNRERYYRRGEKHQKNRFKRWGDEEIRLLNKRELSDHELSKMLNRSVKAIQVKRCSMKNDKDKTHYKSILDKKIQSMVGPKQ